MKRDFGQIATTVVSGTVVYVKLKDLTTKKIDMSSKSKSANFEHKFFNIHTNKVEDKLSENNYINFYLFDHAHQQDFLELYKTLDSSPIPNSKSLEVRFTHNPINRYSSWGAGLVYNYLETANLSFNSPMINIIYSFSPFKFKIIQLNLDISGSATGYYRVKLNKTGDIFLGNYLSYSGGAQLILFPQYPISLSVGAFLQNGKIYELRNKNPNSSTSINLKNIKTNTLFAAINFKI
ncbi:MAG: hypothetical protein HOJ35_03510 [Bdellovibrionales bacterium]|jgi:hypothetical protein|nr:hypothetical protein [Bdellovibrionales bacterium]